MNEMKTAGRTHLVWLFISVSSVAAVLSLSRLVLAVDSWPTELVWAEDGLFPLCIRKAGLVECLVDPFAGYLLGAPRLLAGITAAFPLEAWGQVTNVLAATSWGVLAGLTATWLVARGFEVLTAIAVALLPVLIPLAGLEAVNSIGSIYMPMLFTTTVVTAVGWRGGAGTWGAAVLAFLTAITIPTAVVIFASLTVAYFRGSIRRGSALVVCAALTAGIILQFLVIFTASSARNMAVTPQALSSWLQELPVAVLTLWPGLTFGSTTIFGFFSIPVVTWTGTACAIALLILGVRLALNMSTDLSLAGILLVSGLTFSFLPTVTGYASNRYFVLTVLGVAAAGILCLSWISHNKRRGVLALGSLVLLAAWMSAFPAAQWRAQASPEWTAALERISAECLADPTAPARLEFSPNWPQEDVTQLQPPTNQFAPCSVLDIDRTR